ncbi:unnamed protein product [Kuraishia capsulata CBS 1993]|uniref:1,3-beta-glucanosyltransferase n=1 Tax=Kuraishia capsulata CBS 1993 TaxID=1382522 RepID=W6MTM2_9ASCO|nr:uncharacterized protein KUCA_T00004525001 [Kuraishia capsulata CBS 1993]CDK28542.1 unnamed protein product [Kuraishia capsulata CBS 1993]
MLFKSLISTTLAVAGLSQSVAASFPTIEISGNKFFYSNNGSQFYIKGVAYQADTSGATNTSFVDPLSDKSTCERDIPYLQKLSTNVIRVYALDSDADHSDCMGLLQDAGIYVIADLAEPKLSISTSDPSWTVELYERYTKVVDEMQQYDNTLGFFAGNEVVTNHSNTDAAAFVKAAVRDIKAYIKDKDYRTIPVGYSANDDSKTRVSSVDYFSCGDEDERADFYGINMYEWCGSSSFSGSGYEDRTEEFSDLPVPVFFSEYGCNTVTPRKFTEVGTLFSSKMTDVWSGGIVYMYFEETNNYGLVTIDDDSVSTLDDFGYYSSEIASVSPTSATSASVTAVNTLKCNSTYTSWKAKNTLPPTPQDSVCSCMSNSLSCIVSDDVDEDDYSDLFSTVCGLVSTCVGINADASSATYGAYSFCSSKEKLSFVLDLYYQEQDGDSSACDFDGSATLGGSSSTGDSCSSVLKEAGTAGTGTVTATLTESESTNTSDSDSDSDSSSSGSSKSSKSGSSSSASSSSKSSAAGSMRSPIASFNDLSVTIGLGAFVAISMCVALL